MYRIEMSYTCTIGFVLAAAVRTIGKFLRSPKLWPNIRSHLRTTTALMLQQHRRHFWKSRSYVGGRDAWRTSLLALVGLLYALIETYREVWAAMKAVYCRKKTYQQTWQPKDRRELRNVAERALVLQNLAKTYQSVGRHCWLVILYCVIQYLYT